MEPLSIEDRILRRFAQKLATDPAVPKGIALRIAELISQGRTPTPEEILSLLNAPEDNA
jgi:hypothetical protein